MSTDPNKFSIRKAAEEVSRNPPPFSAAEVEELARIGRPFIGRDKRISDLAMEVLREGKEGREVDLAADVILIRAENARLRKVIRNIEVTCEEGGDYPLFFSHVAHFLRQAGFAQGPEMDEFFKGTNLEKRA